MIKDKPRMMNFKFTVILVNRLALNLHNYKIRVNAIILFLTNKTDIDELL